MKKIIAIILAAGLMVTSGAFAFGAQGEQPAGGDSLVNNTKTENVEGDPSGTTPETQNQPQDQPQGQTQNKSASTKKVKTKKLKAEEEISSAAPVSMRVREDGILLYWKKVKGAQRYVISRKEWGSSEWERMYYSNKTNSVYWLDDSDMTAGKKYEYLVTACRIVTEKVPEDSEETGNVVIPSEASGGMVLWLPKLEITKSEKKSSKRWVVEWDTDEQTKGCRIDYSTDKLFLHKKSIWRKGKVKQRAVFDGPEKGKTYYVRIAAWKKATIDGEKVNCYSAYTFSDNIPATSTEKLDLRTHPVKKKETYWTGKWENEEYTKTDKNGKKVKATRKVKVYKQRTVTENVRTDYVKTAGEKTYGYDTFQGGCTDGKYEYHVLNNRSNNKCRIIKINVKNGKLVKKSKVLALHHGNDLTYNKHKKVLAAVHYTGTPWAISIISPKTLKIKKTINVPLDEAIYGATAARLKKVKSITGIAYNPVSRHYILGIEGSLNYLETTNKFKPVRFIESEGVKDRINQGIECTGEYILRVQTLGSGRDSVEVRDLDGKFVTRMNIYNGYEAESIYRAKKKLRGGIYANCGAGGRQAYTFRVVGY